MDARVTRALLLVAVLVVSMGAKRATPNFIIETADPNACEQLAKAAERYREELAVAWLGVKMPDWSSPCPMHVQVGPQLGAGGATTFVFDRGEVYGWRMNIQGSLERLLDSVLPHEITHMIYASHFRRPLPRWADEGGATSVEATSEKTKHRKMLVQFLQTNRGIAFNTMFAMTEYPHDVMPLYAQGFSLAEYLIEQGGRRKYIAFLDEGLQTNQWGAAIARHYNLQDLGVLQNTWLGWVAQGSPRLTPSTPAANTLAAATPATLPPRPEPNLILRLNKDGSAVAARPQSDNSGPLNSGWRPAESVDSPTPAQLNRVDPRTEVLRR
jgi:hypothetical protein